MAGRAEHWSFWLFRVARLGVALAFVGFGAMAPVPAGAQDAPTAASTALSEPGDVVPLPPSDPCAAGGEVGQLPMRSGAARVSATDFLFCFTGGSFGGVASMGPPLAGLAAPALVPSEIPENMFDRPPGWLAFFALPDGFPAVVVRNSNGVDLGWARTTNGRFAVVYDPDGPLNSTGFSFVGANGEELAVVPTRCAGIEVGSITLPPGNDPHDTVTPVSARVIATAERFCVLPEGRAFEMIWQYLEYGPLRPVDQPTYDGGSVLNNRGGGLVKYLLPEGFAAPITVRDSSDNVLEAVRTPDGRRLLVYDPNRSPGPFSSDAYRFVAPDGTVLAVVDNAPPDPCRDAAPIGDLVLAAPADTPLMLQGPARVSASATAFCVDLVGPTPPYLRLVTMPVSPVGPTDRPAFVALGTGSAPMVGAFGVLVLPDSFPAPIEVRNAAGTPLFSARHPNGRHLLLYDPSLDQASLSRMPNEPLLFTIINTDGATIAMVSTADTPTNPTAVTAAASDLPVTGRSVGVTLVAALATITVGVSLSLVPSGRRREKSSTMAVSTRPGVSERWQRARARP